MGMRATVESLYELQQLLLASNPSSPHREARVVELREKVPAPVLAHFDRLIKSGRTAVALVRRGVCGECHLRVCSGTLSSLIRPTDLYLCDNCGRYLLMPMNEVAARAESTPAAPNTVRKARTPPQELALG